MDSTASLRGKVAIITGASRGIGRAIAMEFARHGAAVTATYRTRADAAEELCREIAELGGDARAARLEVTSREQVRALFREVRKRQGRIDILVNNAGFLEQKSFLLIDDEDLEYTLDVNLRAAFITTQEIMPVFEEQRGGRIINVSSIGGQTGGTKAPHYAAAKCALLSLTKSSAKLLAPCGATVNAIAPGFIRTDMYADILTRTPEAEVLSTIPLGRPGEAAEVAWAALFLAADRSAYITGQVLNVNGGLYMG